MIKSMTGYASESFVINTTKFLVEIKSVNSKNIDLSIRVPQVLKLYENDLRKKLTDKLHRGKIEINVSTEGKLIKEDVSINKEIIKKYIKELKRIDSSGAANYLKIAMSLPNSYESKSVELNNTQSKSLLNKIYSLISKVDTFRKKEGLETEKDIKDKIGKIKNSLNQIKKIDIFTSHHTHYVIGTGANDPQKMDPNASRETLDHSIMYIFAVALEDGDWHHVKSYTKARANKKSTIKIWKSITTYEDKKWTKKYHDPNPMKKSFGAKVIVTLNNGKKIIEQLDRADAHPYGARPFKRQNYINKFLTLTDGILNKKESDRFLKIVQNLKNLKSGELDKLNIEVKKSDLKRNLKKGIF